MTMNAGAFLNRKIREYLLTDIIGVGGMGAVFKAYHVRLKTTRAAKVLRPDLKIDPTFKTRFEQEARILARLENPHLIRIYEFFEEEDHLFLIMEYVRGESFADRMEYMGIMPPEQAVGLICQACEGLSHAHAQGIVHRDLSPDNLMITTLPEGGELLKVIDFGIAKRISLQTELKTMVPDALTTPGVFIGKVKYCSPEQATGKSLDHRSDQYSLALILYEAITGRSAFEAETPMESLTIRLHEPPPKLSEVRPGASYPSALENVIMKAMQRDPEDRYPTIMDFSRALEDALKEDIAEVTAIDPEIVPLSEDGDEIGEVLDVPEDDTRQTIIHSKLALTDISEDFEEVSHHHPATPLPPPPIKQKRKPPSMEYPPAVKRTGPSSGGTWVFLLLTGLITGGILLFLFATQGSPGDAWNWIRMNVLQKTFQDRANDNPVSSPKPASTKPTTSYRKKTSSNHFQPASGDGPFLSTRPGIKPPVILKKVNPPSLPHVPGISYPATVIVEVIVLKNGRIGNIDIIKSVNPDYDIVATETVKKWKFRGGTLNGRPVDIIMDIPITFN